MPQPVHIYTGAPGTAATKLYTAPAGDLIRVNSIIAGNTTGTAATVTLEHVPSGGSPGTGFMLASAVSIAANAESSMLPAGALQLVLNPGDMLYALQGTASAVNLNIDGEQYPYGA